MWGKLGPGLASPAAEEIEPGIPSNTIEACTSVTPKPQPALVVWMPRQEQACGGPSHSGRLLKGHTRLPARESPVGSPRPSVQAELRPSPAGGSTARISGSPAWDPPCVPGTCRPVSGGWECSFPSRLVSLHVSPPFRWVLVLLLSGGEAGF